MKTSKGNVRCRFGRLLSGILSAAMLFSAAAFQIPVSADEAIGGYEVLYDFIKDGYLEDSNLSDNGTDTITEKENWGNLSLASNALPEAVSDGKVRFHFEFMHEYAWRLPQWRVMADEDGKFDGERWYGLSEVMTSADTGEFKIGYYNVKEDNTNLTAADVATFEKGTWYSLDTIYDLTNGMAYYYINGSKIGESSGPKTIAAIGIRLNHADISAGAAHFKNMKLDTGVAAQITDTNDNGAVLEFTRPIEDFQASYVKVKCLETGVTPSVTVEKVNNMKYKINYSTGTNIGGDYTLTFDEAFAAISGISEKTVVYSQKPSVSYDYYINDDFEGYTVEGNADSRNAEDSTFWTKNTSASIDTIAQYGGSGVAGNSTYAVTDGENNVLKLDGSVVPDKSKGNEVGAKYALGNYKVTDDSKGATGKFKVSFDVKNVDNKNENVTATGDANRFALGTNAWGTFILGLSKNKLYIYTKSDGGDPDNDTPQNSVDLFETDNGYHHIDILFDFTNNNQKIMADDTECYNGVMYSALRSMGLEYLTFMQRKCSNSTWSDTNYGEAYTLIDNLNVIDLDSASTSGIKSVQYSSDGINYSPAIDKVDSATKYVKIDFTSAMNPSTLSDINLSNGSNTVAATGTASNDDKTYTLELTDNLAKSTEYTLNIPTTVKTVGGNSFARDYNGRITTTAGTFKIAPLDIKKGGVSVAKSNINVNDKIDAVVNITNTEGREGEAYLCICVYNDDVMTQVNFDKIDLKKESPQSVPITVASTEKIKVKAFLWNDFATMKPLVKNKTVE